MRGQIPVGGQTVQPDPHSRHAIESGNTGSSPALIWLSFNLVSFLQQETLPRMSRSCQLLRHAEAPFVGEAGSARGKCAFSAEAEGSNPSGQSSNGNDGRLAQKPGPARPIHAAGPPASRTTIRWFLSLHSAFAVVSKVDVQAQRGAEASSGSDTESFIRHASRPRRRGGSIS